MTLEGRNGKCRHSIMAFSPIPGCAIHEGVDRNVPITQDIIQTEIFFRGFMILFLKFHIYHLSDLWSPQTKWKMNCWLMSINFQKAGNRNIFQISLLPYKVPLRIFFKIFSLERLLRSLVIPTLTLAKTQNNWTAKMNDNFCQLWSHQKFAYTQLFSTNIRRIA